jgi:type IV pilus assembly protein PilP
MNKNISATIFRKRKSVLAQTSCMLCLLLLSGCRDEDLTDLNQYIAEVKTRPKGPIEQLPEVKVVEPFVFKPEGLRNPFQPLQQPEQEEAETAKNNRIKPDTTRRKEELEAYPLDGLKMVGTIVMNANLWGLVKASDGTVHRVQVGNYMGKNYGKIIRIVTDKIEIMEIVLDKPGTWREQQSSLALAE